jgi:hypothetical protein
MIMQQDGLHIIFDVGVEKEPNPQLF